MTNLNREQTVQVFCQRLNDVIDRSGMSRSAFAAEVGLDRSTLSQLLSANNDRLPRSETIIAIAAVAQISVDWLLGLSQTGKPGAELVSSELDIEAGAHSPMDDRLAAWHTEAIGYKIRYAPMSLPDLLKSEDIIRYEYQEYDGRTPDLRIEQSEAKLAYSRRPETDIEICSSHQSVELFAQGNGVWRDLDASVRKAQLEHMIELLEELYPTLRWFMYDGLKRFSVPYTIFGPKRSAMYLGNMYFVFNSTEHIRVLTKHFDDLIRVAKVQPTDTPDYLRALLDKYLN